MKFEKSFKKELFDLIPDEAGDVKLDTAAKFIIADAIFSGLIKDINDMEKSKRYSIRHPESFGLKPDRKYILRETTKGFVLYLGPKSYIGIPKFIVYSNKDVYKYEKTVIYNQKDEEEGDA